MHRPWIFVRVAVAMAAACAAVPAAARVRRVAPGAGTPVQDAIDAADAGDTVRLAPGVYSERLTIAKPLRLSGSGADRVTIDAGCHGAPPVVVAADRVRVDRLRAVGGVRTQIDVRGSDRTVIADTETLGGRHFPRTCGGEEAGIAVRDARRLTLRRNRAAGFAVAGVWIVATTPDAGPYRLTENLLTLNAAGILLRGARSGVLLGDALVDGNRLEGNLVAGVALDRVARTTVTRNLVLANGESGIRLTTTRVSVVAGNTIGGHAADVADDGVTNCWRANAFATGTLPDPACP